MQQLRWRFRSSPSTCFARLLQPLPHSELMAILLVRDLGVLQRLVALSRRVEELAQQRECAVRRRWRTALRSSAEIGDGLIGLVDGSLKLTKLRGEMAGGGGERR